MVFLNWLSNGPLSPLHGNPPFALKKSVELEKTFRQFIDSTRDLFDTYVIDVEPHAILGPALTLSYPSMLECPTSTLIVIYSFGLSSQNRQCQP